EHKKIFEAAFQRFLGPTEPEYTLASGSATRNVFAPSVERFDLLTFPEAFLPADVLLSVLNAASERVIQFGCVHVGLRLSVDVSSHLFDTQDIDSLVIGLRAVPNLVVSDLGFFHNWLAEQRSQDRFNIASLFTVDFNGRLRICLYAK